MQLNFWAGSKKFGQAQNILGPVKCVKWFLDSKNRIPAKFLTNSKRILIRILTRKADA